MKNKIHEIYKRFKINYEKQSGEVYLARSDAEAVEFVDKILTNSNSSKVVMAPMTKDVEIELKSFFKKKNAASLKLTKATTAESINEADVGISKANFAIAETGTIVELSTNDTERLISSLPRVHIAFLNSANIIESLDEAAQRLRKIYASHPQNCNVTFISGPSRTADIEMTLFLGVHGPQESHVIVRDWK